MKNTFLIFYKHTDILESEYNYSYILNWFYLNRSFDYTHLKCKKCIPYSRNKFELIIAFVCTWLTLTFISRNKRFTNHAQFSRFSTNHLKIEQIVKSINSQKDFISNNLSKSVVTFQFSKFIQFEHITSCILQVLNYDSKKKLNPQ